MHVSTPIRPILTSIMLATIVLAAVPLTSGALAAPAAQAASSAPDCKGTMRWIVNAGSLEHAQSQFPLREQRRYLESPCTFLVGAADKPDYRSWRALKTASAPSVAGLEAVAGDPNVGALLYDPEAWEMTPEDEKRDPAAATCRAQRIAHAQGKLLIATPAIDLLRFIAPDSARPGPARWGWRGGGGHDGHGGRGQGRYPAFERTRVAQAIARCADVYEIQAQGSEANVELFAQFVRAEAQQARAGNPRVIVLAGISTNPTGHRVCAEQVYAAVQAVRADVEGFWLNIPAGGKYCPSCGQPQPQVAAQLLRMLGDDAH